jgi:hypothetical protein
MKIAGNKITADKGKEIYNISNPDVYGKTITLGINDSPENWAERDETIASESGLKEIEI